MEKRRPGEKLILPIDTVEALYNRIINKEITIRDAARSANVSEGILLGNLNRYDKNWREKRGEVPFGKKYKEDFKRMAVELYLDGKPASEISREYNVSYASILSWSKDERYRKPDVSPDCSNDDNPLVNNNIADFYIKMDEIKRRVREIKKNAGNFCNIKYPDDIKKEILLAINSNHDIKDVSNRTGITVGTISIWKADSKRDKAEVINEETQQTEEQVQEVKQVPEVRQAELMALPAPSLVETFSQLINSFADALETSVGRVVAAHVENAVQAKIQRVEAMCEDVKTICEQSRAVYEKPDALRNASESDKKTFRHEIAIMAGENILGVTEEYLLAGLLKHVVKTDTEKGKNINKVAKWSGDFFGNMTDAEIAESIPCSYGTVQTYKREIRAYKQAISYAMRKMEEEQCNEM